MTHRHSDEFAYDEFERYLLSSASIDATPKDLPARVGLALGLAVPAVLAAESVAYASTVASVANGAVAVAQGGSSLAGSALLLAAVKGIAIGLVAGVVAIGTGHAVVSASRPASTATPQGNALSLGAPRFAGLNAGLWDDSCQVVTERTVDGAREGAQAGADTHDELEAVRYGSPIGSDPGGSRRRPPALALRSSDTPPPSPGRAAESSSVDPATSTAKPAVARFEMVTDETPRAMGSSQPALVLPVAELSPAAYRLLRARTIAHVRTLLGRSDSASAIRELDAFRNQVGAKRFGVEEILLRIEALVDLGRRKEARDEADLVERIVPNSAELRRARLLAGSRVVR